ncbi:MAG: hypothetical protein HW378_4618, partial [Anaerolineales bacterium]|nr:hypothetical protein [Anaerolineales bacterium]
ARKSALKIVKHNGEAQLLTITPKPPNTAATLSSTPTARG